MCLYDDDDDVYMMVMVMVYMIPYKEDMHNRNGVIFKLLLPTEVKWGCQLESRLSPHLFFNVQVHQTGESERERKRERGRERASERAREREQRVSESVSQ